MINLSMGTLLLCSMQLFNFDYGMNDKVVTVNNIPTKIMVVQEDYFTVAYDFSKFKEITIAGNQSVIEVLDRNDIEYRCKLREVK